jgi:hypothetical protein
VEFEKALARTPGRRLAEQGLTATRGAGGPVAVEATTQLNVRDGPRP